MRTEHSHAPADIAERLSSANRTQYLRDFIYGGIDGTVTTFAIVAGVAGAGLSDTIIVTLGMANIIADGFSMAASNYSGCKADLDDRARIVAVEHNHIATDPEGEREELRQILALRGLDGNLLEQATDAISANKEKWIDIMLTEEYGLSRDAPIPIRSALATFFAFLLAGSVPLFPFLLGLPDPFRISILVTLLTFFLIGTGKSRWSLTKWWRSGLETLTIGAVAALLAFVVGSLFHA